MFKVNNKDITMTPGRFFIALRSSCLWIFWNFQESTQEKQRDGV